MSKTEEVKLGDKRGAALVYESVFGRGDYIRSLLELIPSDNVITVEENGKPVGCAMFIDVQSSAGNGAHLYGLSVLPKFRLRGYLRVLMSEAEKLGVRHGYKYIYIIPTEDYQFDVYKRMGYDGLMYKNTYAPFEREGKKSTAEDTDRLYGMYLKAANGYTVYDRTVFGLYASEGDFYLTENGYRLFKGTELFESYNNGDIPTGQKLFGVSKRLVPLPEEITVTGIHLI